MLAVEEVELLVFPLVHLVIMVEPVALEVEEMVEVHLLQDLQGQQTLVVVEVEEPLDLAVEELMVDQESLL